MHLACGKLDEFAVLGFDRADKIVIELWSLVAGDGVAVTYGAVGAIPSGSLVPKRFKKMRVFEGENGSTPRGLELDPDGRFVIYALKDSAGITTVFQLDCLTPQAVPTPLVDSTLVPFLSEIEYIEKFDHTSLGRVYVCGTGTQHLRQVVFVDADNDGVFDGTPIIGDDAVLDGLGLGVYEDWINLDH